MDARPFSYKFPSFLILISISYWLIVVLISICLCIYSLASYISFAISTESDWHSRVDSIFVSCWNVDVTCLIYQSCWRNNFFLCNVYLWIAARHSVLHWLSDLYYLWKATIMIAHINLLCLNIGMEMMCGVHIQKILCLHHRVI